MTPDLVGVQREIGLRGSLSSFVRMAWPLVEPGREYAHGWHIDVVCEHLEAVYRGEIKDLIINQPPGTMKSLLVSTFWPAWVWIREPGFKWLASSYAISLSLRDARRMLTIVQSPWFKTRWGDRCSLPKVVAEGDFKNLQGGLRFSTTVGGPATGYHADGKIVDDPIKPQNLTRNALDACIEWYEGTWSSRNTDPAKTRNVIILQRVHDDDLAGYLARRGGYEVLRLPMRYVPKACSYTKVGGDPRCEDGELLWPGHIGEAAVEQLEADMGGKASATVSAQLQQDPVPAGGNIFQKDWFQYYTIRPEKFDFVCQSWDCTFKGAVNSDYVVGQVWGVVGAQYYLLDQERGKWSFPQTLEAIRRLTLRWPKVMTKLVEDKANGPAVIQTLEKEIPGLVAVNPEGGKEARANAVAPLFQAKNVFLPDKSTQPWIGDFETELLRFPFGVNDDSVDACTQALNYLYARKSGYWTALEKLAADRAKAEAVSRDGIGAFAALRRT